MLVIRLPFVKQFVSVKMIHTLWLGQSEVPLSAFIVPANSSPNSAVPPPSLQPPHTPDPAPLSGAEGIESECVDSSSIPIYKSGVGGDLYRTGLAVRKNYRPRYSLSWSVAAHSVDR